MALGGLYKIIIKNKHTIKQKAEDRINSLVNEYIPDSVEDAPCPTPAELERILAIREQIKQPLLTLNKKVEPLSNFLEKLPPILETIQIIIATLKLLPIPGIATTAGLVVTFGDTLAFLKDKVKDFKQEVRNGTQVIDGVNETIQDILTKLAELDKLIEKCSEGAIEESPEFAALIEDQQKQNNENPLEEEYRGYQIKIEEEKVGKLTKRYAVVFGTKGERLLTTDKSFSATTRVLINEAKFEVDKLL
jgi:uncharacterized phage infection (PIP) family protein YhgE